MERKLRIELMSSELIQHQTQVLGMILLVLGKDQNVTDVSFFVVLPSSTHQKRYTPRQRRQKRVLMTHKCRGSIVVLSISKSVEPNEDHKEMISGFR